MEKGDRNKQGEKEVRWIRKGNKMRKEKKKRKGSKQVRVRKKIGEREREKGEK